ncbi:formate/nitrite transporter family protein [Phenylobacterium deserti]|uniref:Formate/nitrite transporter family protein n=1 Tax=Phenylobacterium deserti TaxID=1914756 RepID=A0A328AUA0_9CAUL|nr:formate/nitrite transporter family protein [Phenylobacterium deserti]RAK58169.1 formate/nitrite transporter family protein [Phenylobacterium deserti]
MSERAADSPKLEASEQQQAERHAPLRPLVIHEIIRAEGEVELQRSVWSLSWSGLAAGLSMGFSFATQALLKSDLGEGPGAHALASFGYTLGFLIVVLGRQQLFTESTLTAVLPALTHRNLATWLKTGRLWGVVLAANIVGTWLFATALAWGRPLPAETGPALAELAAATIGNGFWATVLRAVLSGWLIALMVWLLPSAHTAKILVIVAITWVVALAELPHSIAGSVEASYGVLTGAYPFADYLLRFLVPTLLGNVIGGVSLVAMLNHAPLSEEVEDVQDEG